MVTGGFSLEFSPCPGERVEVLGSITRWDGPRFAYVDASRAFRVVEASSGEKGPFRILAEGRLEPADPLVIALHDEDQPVARVTLQDWAAQAGTDVSPTAGWGVPVNAIEFSLNGEAPSSPASIFVTLAGTSVGRGWDCVGHRGAPESAHDRAIREKNESFTIFNKLKDSLKRKPCASSIFLW